MQIKAASRFYRAVLLLAVLAPSLFVYAGEPEKPDLVPLYEPVNNDHRFSQTVKGALRWGGTGFVLTGLGGVWYYRDAFTDPSTSFWQAEPVAVAATTVGFFSGALGALLGYAQGLEYNENEQQDSSFHTVKDNLGGRFLLVFANYPRFHLTWRTFNTRHLIPDSYRLGFVYRYRSGIPSGNFFREKEQSAYDETFLGLVLKLDASAVFDIDLGKAVTPYYGVGGGFAWARDYDEDTERTRRTESGFMHLFAGFRLNIVDYVYVEAEADWEPYGIYYNLKDLNDYHGSGNWQFHLYIGSYLYTLFGPR